MTHSHSLLSILFAACFCISPAQAADPTVASEKAAAKTQDKQADADYRMAKKTCETLNGDAVRTCMRKARAAHERAETNAHGRHEMADANTPEEKAEAAVKMDNERATPTGRRSRNVRRSEAQRHALSTT